MVSKKDYEDIRGCRNWSFKCFKWTDLFHGFGDQVEVCSFSWGSHGSCPQKNKEIIHKEELVFTLDDAPSRLLSNTWASWQMVKHEAAGAVKQACSLCPPTQLFAHSVYQMAALYQGVAPYKAPSGRLPVPLCRVLLNISLHLPSAFLHQLIGTELY